MPPNKPSSTGNEYENAATEINVSQAFGGIRKARGARNLLDPKKAKSVAMAEWENIDSDEKKYKRMFMRSEVPAKQEAISNAKKKEISWADSMLSTRKYVKNGHPEKHSDEDADKGLVRTEVEKQEDEIRQITQTSVVYFSKSNSYDGRVIMASRREEEGKEKAREKKLKCKKHRSKEDEYERKECLDAALAAAAVRAVVEVSPQLSQQGLPRAYRVKTSHSHSHSFLVEPVWNEGMQSSDSLEPSASERPQTAPEETNVLVPKECCHVERRCHRHRVPSRARTRSHSPPSEPLSSSVSWNTSASHTVNSVAAASDATAVAVPAALPVTTVVTAKASPATSLALAPAKSHPSRTITLSEEAIPPCNVSVNIQLVASTSNVSARAVLTDRAGSVREVPASVRWEAQNKSTAYAVLDSMNVAKSIEHAFAKAVMDNAKSITSAISISNSEKGTTTTSSLENTAARIALIEKSTCTTTEELSSEGISEKETRVTTFVQERVLKTTPERQACAVVSPIPEEVMTSSSREIPQNTISASGFEKGSIVSSVESVNPPNIPKKISASSTGPYSSTDTNVGSKDKLESSVSKSRSSLLNPHKNEDKFEKQDLKPQIQPITTQRVEIHESPVVEDAIKRTPQNNEQNAKFLPKDLGFQSAGTVSSQEYVGKLRMEGWPQGRMETAWVNEVTRMVSEELKARAVRRLRAEDRPAGLRRAVMEERMPKDPMEQLVALQVRKVLGEMDKRGKRIQEEVVSEERTSSEQLDERGAQEADTSALETDTMVEQMELDHDESDRAQRVEVRMVMTEEESASTHSKTMAVHQQHPHQTDERSLSKQSRSNSKSRERRKSREKKQRKQKLVTTETEREIENTHFDVGWNPEQWNNQRMTEEEMLRAPSEMTNMNSGWSDDGHQYIIDGQAVEELQFMTQSDVDMTTADEQEMLNSMATATTIGTRTKRGQSSEVSNVPSYASYAYSMRTEASVESTEHAREFFPLPRTSMHSGPKSTAGSTTSRHDKKTDHSQGSSQYPSQSQQHSQKQNPGNATTGPNFPGHFPPPSQNAPSWPVAMTPFGPYGPFPQPWYPPQMNPFVPGAVPYPNVLPYRLMVPYRPMPDSNNGSTPNNYHPKNQMDMSGSNMNPSENEEFGKPVYASGVMTPGLFAALVQHIVDRLDVSSAQPCLCIENNGAPNISGETLNKQSYLCESSISTTSYTTQEEFNAGVSEELEVKEKAVSDLESSLVALLRKCSYALGQQAEQLAGALQEQQLQAMDPGVAADVDGGDTSSDATCRPPPLHAERAARARSPPCPCPCPSAARRPTSPSHARCCTRVRAADDPLELLRQMRIRQQERELARARLPGQKVPLRRSKVVASCAKKEKIEKTHEHQNAQQ